MTNSLRGGSFRNRYRITGSLTTLSPLHVGSGEASAKRLDSEAGKKQGDAASKTEEGQDDETHEVSLVIKDHEGRPYIPGSTLRGVMRHWLLDMLQGFGDNWAATLSDDEQEQMLKLRQEEQAERIESSFSFLQLLFGTPFNAGKLEIWDAPCLTPRLNVSDGLLFWDDESLTYVDTSVAINPETGTAHEHLLYNSEVVPPGVTFEFNIAAHNLSEDELGIVFFCLQGFNSMIYPIRVGARGGRGYGRMRLALGDIFVLRSDDEENVKTWIQKAIDDIDSPAPSENDPLTGNAAFYGLPRLEDDDRQKLIKCVKATLKKHVGGNDV